MTDKNVLVVCTHNAVRSQMSEALINRDVPGWKAYSAGTAPAGVNPLVMTLLSSEGYDVSGLYSKHIKECQEQKFDLIVFVCDSAAETCVNISTDVPKLHLPLPDPVALNRTDEERLKGLMALLKHMRLVLPEALNGYV